MTPPREGNARSRVWLAALLVVGVFLAYQPAWRAGFIWDDDAHLTAHKCIVGPLGFKEIWTTAEANYFPLVLTTFWVVHKFVGLNPVAFHLLGIALHAAATLVLWAVLRKLGVRWAWLGAALWAFHPVQVKSVAWVSEIINTQSGLFFLLSVFFALTWFAREPADPKRLRDYVLACLCGAAAMLSKPSTVMLPVVLALCFWWKRGAVRARDLVALAPFFAMAAAASAWAIWEQRVHQAAVGAEWSQTLGERAIIAGRAVAFYLGKLLWPQPISFIYPRWTLEPGNALSFVPTLAVAAALAVLGWLGWTRAAWRPLFVTAASFVVLLFPVLGFFNVYFFRYSFVADHFQYLASIAPLALVAAGVGALATRLNSGVTARVIQAVGGTAVFLFAVLTWSHARVYESDETIWRDTLRKNPDSFLAHNNLGALLLSSGRAAEAAEHFAVVVRMRPEVPESRLNLGRALMALPGRGADALAELEAALRLRPNEPQIHLSLGNALALVPARRSEAVAHFETVLRAEPANAEAHAKLGALLELDPARRDAALAHYEAAVRAKPDYTKVRRSLAALLARDPARRSEAIQHYEIALTQEPDSAITHNNLAIVFAESGRLDDAQRHFERATQLDPNYADARNNLARLKTMRGNSP